MKGTAKQILAATATLAGLWSNSAAGQPIDDPPRLSIGTDHWLTVTRDGMTRTVRLVEHRSLASEPRGAVMLFTGDFGQYDYYERGEAGRITVVETLLDRDIDVWSISYPYGDGWADGAQGLGYRAALRIVEDVCSYVAANARSDKLAAQGNSGGGLQILYALQAGTCTFEIAVVTGSAAAKFRAEDNESKRLCWGGTKTDHLMGFDPGDCVAQTLTKDEWQALDTESLLAESVEGLGRVVIVNSDLNTRDTAQGWWVFRGLSLPGKALLHVSGAEHAVDETAEGSQAVIDFLDQCIDGC